MLVMEPLGHNRSVRAHRQHRDTELGEATSRFFDQRAIAREFRKTERDQGLRMLRLKAHDLK